MFSNKKLSSNQRTRKLELIINKKLINRNSTEIIQMMVLTKNVRIAITNMLYMLKELEENMDIMRRQIEDIKETQK